MFAYFLIGAFILIMAMEMEFSFRVALTYEHFYEGLKIYAFVVATLLFLWLLSKT